jgi:hypothetical protein
MSRPGKTIVIILLVACAVIFIAIVWTALATDDDSSNSAPQLAAERFGGHGHAAVPYGEPWPTPLGAGDGGAR